jgi:hypothetical protein
MEELGRRPTGSSVSQALGGSLCCVDLGGPRPTAVLSCHWSTGSGSLFCVNLAGGQLVGCQYSSAGGGACTHGARGQWLDCQQPEGAFHANNSAINEINCQGEQMLW